MASYLKTPAQMARPLSWFIEAPEDITYVIERTKTYGRLIHAIKYGTFAGTVTFSLATNGVPFASYTALGATDTEATTTATASVPAGDRLEVIVTAHSFDAEFFHVEVL